MPKAATKSRAPKSPLQAPPESAPRRTQRERREGTIRKLLDAATDTLIEIGWAEASVQRICARAEVSQGALFRHFATREALMVAVGEDIGHQLLLRYRTQFEVLGQGGNDLVPAMLLVREACRSRLNQAWYELAVAARTNASLRKGLEPVGRRYYDDIERLARDLLPDLAALLGDRFAVVVETVIAIFDGEVVHRLVLKRPKLEESRLELLATIVQLFTNHARPSR